MIQPLDIEMARFGDEYDSRGYDNQNKTATRAVREYDASMRACPAIARCIEHVKDGKPLTPVGAKLLGVPWMGA